MHHLTAQLGKTPEQHVGEIRRIIEDAAFRDMKVNVYLEDWSNGVQKDFDYVKMLVDEISLLPVERIMLCDTLGVLTPLVEPPAKIKSRIIISEIITF